MPSLRKSDDRFTIRLSVIQGGSGLFSGVLTEPDQGDVPSYLFSLPRRLLRVDPGCALQAGAVVKTPEGRVFLVGDHGPSEKAEGPIFNSFVLFECTGQYKWQRRGKEQDTVTGLMKDTSPVTQPVVWGFYEPATMEGFDRALRTNMETGRFMTNAPVEINDIVKDMKVSRSDPVMGLRLITLG